MDLRKKNKAFIFSFLAIFLSIVIFAFAGLYFYAGDYTKDRVYTESRINYLDREIDYFKEVHIKNVIEFSAYNALVILLEDRPRVDTLDGNYSRFNDYMLELMYYGTLGGVTKPEMNEKTINYFLSSYKDDFRSNHKGEFNYTIKAIKFFEKNPYFVSFLVYSQYNVSTKDDISSWNFDDVREYAIPIYGITEPTFLLERDQVYPLKSADLELDSINFSIDIFNKTVSEVYSLVYQEPTHKYTIGNSFLNRLLGREIFGYKDVIGFWSFDYDEDIGRVYDTALFSLGRFYGNTLIYYDFDNKSVTSTQVFDKTDYSINGTLSNVILENETYCVSEQCLNFNGIDSQLDISRNELNLNWTNKFSISFWVKPNESGMVQSLFNYGNLDDEIISISLTENLTVSFSVGNHVFGGENIFQSEENLTLNEWSNIIVTYEGDTGEGNVYINGIGIDIDIFRATFPINNFLKSGTDINIGHDSGINYFSGGIDEFNFFVKVLTGQEISYLLSSREAQYIDYKDSFLGKGIEFDGENDYLEIDLDELKVTDNYTIEIWFEPSSNEDLFTRQILLLTNETG